MRKVEILVPVANAKFREIGMAQRPLDLKKKVVGLMWDKKANGDLLLSNLGEALEKRFSLSGTLMKSKPNPTTVAPTHVLEEISTKCDFVILAIAD